LPIRTTVDDMIIPLRTKLLSNCAMVYEPAAIAVEEITPDLQSEFRRRCRNGAGAYQGLMLLLPLLHPRYGWTSFSFISHKVCRLLSPICMVMLLLTNLAALDRPGYQV